VTRLGPGDIAAVREVNLLFATAFEDQASYASALPSDEYLNRLLEQTGTIVLTGRIDGVLAGALVAYVLHKFEQERSEIYIYDLAVAKEHRRCGVATALIERLQGIAAEVGAWAIYVQADHGDDPAIALYTKHGTREDVLHFDIAPTVPR
jgi:aminoglycoside 3-N-acetyltransferase I